jgi:hypothetical protein
MKHVSSASLVLALVACSKRSSDVAPPAPEPVVKPPPSTQASYTMLPASPTPWFLTRRDDEVVFRSDDGTLAAFDLEKATWSTLHDLPKGFEPAAVAVLGDGRLLLLASEGGTNASLLGDGRGEWTAAKPLPSHYESWGVGVLPDGRVVVAGGYKAGSRPASDESWLYDAKADRWTAGPRLPEGTWRGESVVSNGSLVMIATLPNPQHPRAFVLDAAASAWSVTNAGVAHNGFRPVLLDDGRVALLGGGTVGEAPGAPPTRIFDPRTKEFSQLEALPAPRVNPAAVAIATGVVGVFGGDADGLDGSLDDSFAWLELAKPGWHEGPSLPPGLQPQYAARHGDHVFVFCHRRADATPESPWTRSSIVVVSAAVSALLGR